MRQYFYLLFLSGWLAACQATAVVTPTPFSLAQLPAASATFPPSPADLITPTLTATATQTATAVPPTHTATAPNTPTPTLTATATATPTATPIGPCSNRVPPDDLLNIVTLTYSLSRHYEPSDLVPLDEYFPVDITLGYPSTLRQIAVGPLVDMIEAMHQAGLQPFIISGYRSYASQAIAWDKWARLEPDRVSQLSAPPGHSEHQLGTVVDFGSPELAEIVGNPDIEFHTYFYQTSEGQWLLNHAHEYGFTLSYPREDFELTGFYYEPWHFRYIGTELATQLHEQGLSLTRYQLDTMPLPCVSDDK